MPRTTYTRRDVLALGGCAIAASFLANNPIVQAQKVQTASAFELVDEPSRGYYGTYDLDNFGPPKQRKVRAQFKFPADVDVEHGYGIDISHYTEEVPWAALKSAKVNYVYIKASQSLNGRDGKFDGFWNAAKTSLLPYGAYHFLTAGVSGNDQAKYFLSRLAEVGNLTRGNLQPALDLEWDIYGPSFTKVVKGHSPTGEVIYKDYWDDLSEAAVVSTINEFVSTLKSGGTLSTIKPIIYTNRSWWDTHIPDRTVFAGCTVWTSDYRKESYVANSPRSVAGHEYYLWQFTDQAHIEVDGKLFGPYDSNKLIFGGIDHITIS